MALTIAKEVATMGSWPVLKRLASAIEPRGYQEERT